MHMITLKTHHIERKKEIGCGNLAILALINSFFPQTSKTVGFAFIVKNVFFKDFNLWVFL